MNAKVIAVWGANGSGKTTTAVNLAYSLAQRNFHGGTSFLLIYITEKCRRFAAVMSLTTAGYITRLLGGETKEYACAGRKNSSVCAVRSRQV